VKIYTNSTTTIKMQVSHFFPDKIKIFLTNHTPSYNEHLLSCQCSKIIWVFLTHTIYLQYRWTVTNGLSQHSVQQKFSAPLYDKTKQWFIICAYNSQLTSLEKNI